MIVAVLPVLALIITMAACGGGGGGTQPPPPPSQFTLTVNSTSPASGVAITVTPNDATGAGNGTTSFTRTYTANATVTLTAPATEPGGNLFSSWTGCTTVTNLTCTVTITSNITVTANYAAPATLTVNSTTPASGVAITVSPNDKDGSGNGSTSFTRTYATGAAITLTAPATAGGNVFTSWTGCTSATTVTCHVTLNANTTVTANYVAPITLTVNSTTPASGVAITVSPNDSTGSGNGTTSFTRAYAPGAAVTLTAPATSSVGIFTSWTGCTTTATVTCNVTLNANTTVTANYAPPTLTVNSVNPASGVAITATPNDNNAAGGGNTSFALTYNVGTAVTLTAPATSGGNIFSSWTGCTTATTVTCHVTLNANTTVTATYVTPATLTVNSTTPASGVAITVTPNDSTGAGNGSSSFARTYLPGTAITLTAPPISGGNVFSAWTGCTTAATVTCNVTLNANTTVTANYIVLVSTGPVLTVDEGTQTHAISPLIYGFNYAWPMSAADVADAGVTVDRWGGNGTSRYNYKLDVSNIGHDWYFETLPNSNSAYPDTSDFNTAVTNDKAVGALTLGTVPVNGWVAKRVRGCSFPVSLYGAQTDTDPYWPDCGRGVCSAVKLPFCTAVNANITGNDPTLTSMQVDENWTKDWVAYLVTKFGDAAHGGVAMYDLDNEPTWWDGNHIDVHPLPFTYDEVTNNGLKVAKAIKTSDPTAAVNGPVIDFWPAYFYSMKDIRAGWTANGNWNGNPTDYNAHGKVYLLEYYLQQFKAAQDDAVNNPTHIRYLDYLDLHTYFSTTNFATSGTNADKLSMLNSTRALWDPTYTSDSTFKDPADNSKNIAPMIIPRAKAWIANDYPGTKLAFTEYNWGFLSDIAGGVAQADVLGIFGREGLDVGTIWGPPDLSTTDSQGKARTPDYPGHFAFKIYRNYDSSKSTTGQFGDMAIASTSADQSQLSVYGALRTADNVVTIVVLNKTFANITSDLSLPNLTATGPAKMYLYSGANLQSIVAQPDKPVTAPVAPGAPSTINNVTYPAMSITLYAIPK